MENFASVNWLAVFAGAIVSFLGCWLWYSPKVFGKKWAAGSGVSMDSDTKPPVFALVAQFIAFLLLATVVGITATSNALFTAIIAILAVAIFVAASSGFVNKNGAAIIIETSYIIIAGVIMIAAQGLL